MRPANSPVVLRIFDLGHGEEIRAPRPLSSGVSEPYWPERGEAFKLQSAFTLMKLDLMMKILHTDMSQIHAPCMTKYPISDYIISGDDQIIRTQSERFLSSYFNTLMLIFCSDRLPW